jgi:four helix bundle protein
MAGNLEERKYDLEERTALLGKRIINFVKELPRDAVSLVLIKQIVRSGTSIGANYVEANESLSHKDFLLRLKIVRKETKETLYWMAMIFEANKKFLEERTFLKNEGNDLISEVSELIRIFSSGINKLITKGKENRS